MRNSCSIQLCQFKGQTHAHISSLHSGNGLATYRAGLLGGTSGATAPGPSPETGETTELLARSEMRQVVELPMHSVAVGAVEAAYHQKYGIGTDLSEQQLIDCSFRVYERDYEYISLQSVCRQLVKKPFVNITRYVNITSGDEDELKQAVTSVSISFDTSEIRYYRSGVFTSNYCGNTLKDLRHFALAVGYGIENGVPYWLIKNSWGEDWGEKGYFKVEMGKNMCAYPVVA
ncbi:hypothetical protein YC2023_035110 [Brassica napus]